MVSISIVLSGVLGTFRSLSAQQQRFRFSGTRIRFVALRKWSPYQLYEAVFWGPLGPPAPNSRDSALAEPVGQKPQKFVEIEKGPTPRPFIRFFSRTEKNMV
jgi:hypothetical protein